MRYFIYFSYRGTVYHGWQKQPNALSVQETMETALSTILRCPIELVGAGRTDTGVHAQLMVAHFDYEDERIGGIGLLSNLPSLASRLNHLLPHDIAIHKIVPVKADAHARFDAISRTYEYRIVQYKSPFLHGLVTELGYTLDFDKMNQAAQLLLGEHDFKSFCRTHTDVKTTLCTITQAEWKTSSKLMDFGTAIALEHWNTSTFSITANRFLRNMVRAVVGTLIEVGRGKMTIDKFQKVIDAQDRQAAGQSAPAEGLYLTNIVYPDHIFL